MGPKLDPMSHQSHPTRPRRLFIRPSPEGFFSEVGLPLYGVLGNSQHLARHWHSTELVHLGMRASSAGAYSGLVAVHLAIASRTRTSWRPVVGRSGGVR